MHLKTATWQEIDTYLTKSTGIIIPIGSTEQHGPTGMLGTDFICPEVIAAGIAKREDILVAPTIAYGVAQHHLGFSGTMSVRPTTLIALLVDLISSLVKHGFTHIYVLNGHGGNTASIDAAFAEVYSKQSFGETNAFSKVKCKQFAWWMTPGLLALSRKHHGKDEGYHATPGEIALTYYAYPEAVKTAELTPVVAPTADFYHAEHYRSVFPDGRIGSDPSKASVESGKALFEHSVSGITEDYLSFLV